MKSNTLRRTLCVLLAVLTLVSCLVPAVMAAGSPSSEAGKDDQTLYEKKRVSVLFDNSGSMRTLWNTAKDDKRAYYSSYALQMLASMMNDYDELWITPMNVKIDNKNDTRPATIDDAILFPFTTNRENDISDFVSKYMTINREVSYGQKLTPLSNALTPLSSVAVAIESLYREDGATVDHDAKNWIVILTDGKFTDENEKDITEVSTVAAELAKQLDAHEDLHMIYIGLGTAADLSGNATLKKYGDRFVGKLCNAETVVSTMREITNLMCDRYTLDVDVTISKAPDGKTLATVDLSSVPFPLISLSYSIQDFGGTVLNASCGGADYPPTNCVITPPAELGLQSGCTGVIRDSAKENPVLFNTDDTGKTMVLTLSKEVSADNIVLMAEPALYMTPVFQYEKDGAWVEGTLAELSKKLKAGDECKDLYHYWGSRIAEALFSETNCIINLASKEYSQCVSRYLSEDVCFTTCVFGEEKSGKVIEKGTMCKMARGEMVRYMAENQIENPEEIKSFARLGYRYSPTHSADDLFVFIRDTTGGNDD